MLESAGTLLTNTGHYYVKFPFIGHRVTSTHSVLFHGNPEFWIRTRISCSVLCPRLTVGWLTDSRLPVRGLDLGEAQDKTDPNAEIRGVNPRSATGTVVTNVPRECQCEGHRKGYFYYNENAAGNKDFRVRGQRK